MIAMDGCIEIPYPLARLGHTVRGYCLSYQGAAGGTWSHDASPGLLEWESRPLDMGIALYSAHLRRRLRNFRPDVIVGASDIPHVALADRLGQQLDVPHAHDRPSWVRPRKRTLTAFSEILKPKIQILFQAMKSPEKLIHQTRKNDKGEGVI